MRHIRNSVVFFAVPFFTQLVTPVMAQDADRYCETHKYDTGESANLRCDVPTTKLLFKLLDWDHDGQIGALGWVMMEMGFGVTMVVAVPAAILALIGYYLIWEPLTKLTPVVPLSRFLWKHPEWIAIPGFGLLAYGVLTAGGFLGIGGPAGRAADAAESLSGKAVEGVTSGLEKLGGLLD